MNELEQSDGGTANLFNGVIGFRKLNYAESWTGAGEASLPEPVDIAVMIGRSGDGA